MLFFFLGFCRLFREINVLIDEFLEYIVVVKRDGRGLFFVEW